ncbi:MAG TPA: MBL fold metallo-hydrolase [Candidatus Aminicenantes bacterium]|nr:MBL fold metallo-hydrolase [Candidatus Aminicenantes bacterium]
MPRRRLGVVILSLLALAMNASPAFEADEITTPGGPLRITFIGHGTLRFDFSGRVIYVDPDGRLADFAAMPKADLILVTHQHGDHFDPQAIDVLRRAGTEIIVSPACLPLPAGARVMRNGDRAQAAGLAVEAVPAYNLVHQRPDGRPFHPRGEGNGYLVSFAGLRVYVAGDSEDIPEMAELRDIAVAFLPMNLPYTMTPEMTARAARSFRPRILYPYHFSATDPQRLLDLLGGDPAIEVRVRRMN